MRFLEIVDALAVKPEADPGFTVSYRMPNPMKVFEMCSSLVVVVMSDGTQFDASTSQDKWQLQFAHSTVQEYFLSGHFQEPSQELLDETNAKAALVITCLTYLSNVDCNLAIEASRLVDCDIDEELGETGQNFPLSGYSVQYWAGYARCAEARESIRRLILKFLHDIRGRGWMGISFFVDAHRSYNYTRWRRKFGEPVVPLLYVASVGLSLTANTLMLSYSDVEIGHGHSIHVASYKGHVDILRLLLKKGANVDAQTRLVTPLQIASNEGHKEIVQILLDYRADVNAEGGNYGTALYAASGSSHKDVVQILLDHGADVNAKGGYYGTALLAASRYGNKDVVQTLLDNGASVNSPGPEGTALMLACEEEEEGVVQILLDRGAEVNAVDVDDNKTALEKASSKGRVEVVQMLLDHGANIGFALPAAATGAHVDIVRMLLEQNLDASTQGSSWNLDLEMATWSGDIGTAQLLLNHGVDISFGLPSAASHGDIAMVRRLLRVGVNIDTRHPEYGSAIEAAARLGEVRIVRILLNHGAEVGDALEEAFDALSHPTAEGRHEEVLQLLLEERNRQRIQHLSGADLEVDFEIYSDTDTENVSETDSYQSSQAESEVESDDQSENHSDSGSDYHSANEYQRDAEAESDDDSERWYEADSGRGKAKDSTQGSLPTN